MRRASVKNSREAQTPMEKITIYQKPTCTTRRQVHSVLKEAGVDFESVNYYLKPLSEAKLRMLLKKMGLTARELLRKKEPLYKKLKFDKRDLTEEELMTIMVRNPDLIQRPSRNKERGRYLPVLRNEFGSCSDRRPASKN